LTYTQHLEDMLLERQIERSWVEHAISEPESMEELGDGTRHYLRRVIERGERWLRVIVNVSAQPPRAVTVFRSQAKGLHMRLKVDKASDALYFRLDESAIVDSEEVRPGVILDINERGQVVGVEFLGIRARTTEHELTSLPFETR
jgi:uncharacterized protein YuzE